MEKLDLFLDTHLPKKEVVIKKPELYYEFVDIDYYDTSNLREYVNVSKSYDVNLTFIRYNPKYSHIWKIQKLLNGNILSKEYYKKHRPEILIKMKRYYQKHKEKLKTYGADYYQKNKEKIKSKRTCECGRIVSNGGYLLHLRSKLHNKLIKKEKPVIKKEIKIKIKITKKEYYKKNKKEINNKVLDYYYKTRRNINLEKITCKCGRTVSKGNYHIHLKSNIHKKRINI